MVKNRIIMPKFIKPLTHLLSILDPKTSILLLKGPRAAIWKCTIVFIHFALRMKPVGTICQFHIYLGIKLAKSKPTNAGKVLGKHI